MTKAALVGCLHHYNKHVRKIVLPHEQIVAKLDEYKSSMGISWIKSIIEIKICTVQGPSNTNHYLQPADQYVSRTLKQLSGSFMMLNQCSH